MAMRYLGEEFDIHTGGADILFPHNENEIAQCEALNGKGPARYWVHSELVLAGGRKMSRSSGNALTLKDIENLGYPARAVRYLLLSTHYRQPLSYSEDKMNAARAALRRIDAFVIRLQRCTGERRGGGAVKGLVEEALSSFESAMESDLNVPMALGAVFTMIRKVNQQFVSGELSKEDASLVLDALARINTVVAVVDFNPAAAEHEDPEIERLISERDEARERKDYEEADRIREGLKRRHVVLEDTVYGTMYWLENGIK
jgi:cysteinyl-tRNA synthetase